METKLEDPGHVVAQRYLEKRGFNYWGFMQQMGESVRVISHRQCLENCGLDPQWAKEGVYYLWFDYPDSHYGSGRCLNPTKRMGKMLCPANTPVPLYIPPDVEPQDTVYFCESVLKSIKMAEQGFCAFGGNGVNIVTSAGLPPNIPGDMLDNAKRAAILFDSDVRTNKNVILAAQKLALALTIRWPHLEIVSKQLPEPPDLYGEQHWGLDDYCAYYGTEEFTGWVKSAEDESPFEQGQRGRHLLDLSARYAICKSPVGIVCFESGNIHSAADFKNTLEANRKFYYNDPESGRGRKACGATEYIEWRERNEVDLCRYLPGSPPGFDGDISLYNKWRDDGVVAAEGDVTVFLDFLYNAIPRDGDANLLMQMLAYSLQNRGWRWEKLVVLISVMQSTGKSTLAKIIRKLYGPSNAISIDPDSFGRDFNGLFMEREVAILDDAGKIKPADYPKIQRLVTDDEIDVNVKFGGQYMAPNYLNLVVTSNAPDLINLRGEERRLFALEMTPKTYYPQGSTYWTELYDWLGGGGYAHIRWWLMHMDLEGFETNFMPPLNPMKIQMMEAGRSDMDNWVLDLKENSQEVMGCVRMYYTPEELIAKYLQYIGGGGLSESHKNGLKNKLMQSLNTVGGFKKANGGAGVTFSKPKKHKKRFWNISGPEQNDGVLIREDFALEPMYITQLDELNDHIGVQGTGV